MRFKMAKKKVSLFDFENTSFYFNYFDKVDYHRTAKSALNKLAKEFGLVKGEFKVSSNMAGDACAGEVTLHTEKLYLMICEKHSSNGLQILYRTCNGQKDYSGGTNQYADLSSLNDEAFKEKLLKIQLN